MCGIAAIFRQVERDVPPSVVAEMTRAVAHRGPDGEGWLYLAPQGSQLAPQQRAGAADWTVGLGHRRLSILDLSPAGAQPMAYRDHLWITYNGEIYNYVELREELVHAGHAFRSHSDTEVILAAFEQWGPQCFARLRGMWGLVLVDGRRRRAFLSRDRLGIKPLYCASAAGLLAVASEIKQFQHVPGVPLAPDESVLRDYLLTGYEQADRTFFAAVAPLPAATWQEIDLDTLQPAEPVRYWHPERVVPAVDDADEAGRLFCAKLQESVRIHLRSDVPVGCALSGGLDSSALAACISILAGSAEQRFETFSVAFPDTPIDEADFAREVAAAVRSHAHYVSPAADEFVGDLDRFVWMHDEPVGSLAQYACYALARLTRSCGVPVTLNGQGGDEILGGYWQSYFLHLRGLARRGRWLRLAGQFAGALLPGGNAHLARQAPVMWRRYRSRRAAAATAPLAARSAHSKLEQLVGLDDQARRVFEIRDMFLPRLLKWDDRNYMAFSVEGRYPFLDHEVIELALTFSPRALYRRGWTKEPLRRGLAGMLPRSVLRRKTKFGFETPQDDWLCGPLRPAIEQWLAGDAPLWQFVPPAEARALADEVWALGGARDEPGQALLRLFLADRWLRCFALQAA